MKFLRVALIFSCCLLFLTVIVYLFPTNNIGTTIARSISTAHVNHLISSLSESIFFQSLLAGEAIATGLDNFIPLFPSGIRQIWWTPQVITLFYLLPIVLIFTFVMSKKPKIGLIFFLFFFLLVISISKIVTTRWDAYVVSHRVDIALPWSPNYIWMSDGQQKNNQYVEYRYTWKQKNKAQKAEITVSCLGHYQLTVNDMIIYHGPVFAVLPKVYADKVDIAAFAKGGENTIDIICIHIDGLTHEYPAYLLSGLLVGGRIQDGLYAHNLADNRLWKYTIMQTIKPTERIFDAGYKESYDLTGKGSVFQVPIKQKFPYIVLPRPIPLLKYRTIELKEISSGIYDLGIFSSGYLKIQSSQNKPCKTAIVYGVSLDQTGSPPIYMGQKDAVIFPPAKIVWQQISRRSGRYIGIKGDCDTRQMELTFTQVFNNFSLPKAPTGLTLEDKSIFTISLNSLRNNVQDHIEDSVDREKATYLGDALSVSACLLAEKGNEHIVKQTIVQFADSQKSNGSFPSMAPSGLDQFIPSYSLQWPSLLEMYLDRTGDLEFAREMWPHLKKLVDWAQSNTSDSGFFANVSRERNWWNFFDWTPTSTSLAYQTQNQLWYLRSLEVASEIAPLVGKDPAFYNQQARELQKKLWQHAYIKDNGVFVDSFDEKRQDGVSLVTNALAGSLGIFPTKDANDAAIAYFQKDYTTESPYSESWVVDWMIRSGQKDLALQTIRDYWGGMVKDGATSVYEVYKPGVLRSDQLNQSYSHAWGCSPTYSYKKIFTK